jgi:dTDP-glucose 4,6-dehydratase
MKKEFSLLIIGGTGFFGKSILDSFKRGLLKEFNIIKILILARNTDKFKLEFPELISNYIEFINGDISTITTLPEVDFVIHAATSTNMNDYKSVSNNIGKNNFNNAIANYCKLALSHHLKSKILYCSSGAVYGKQPLNIEKIDENFTFQEDLSDLSVEKKNYCLGKRFAEKEIINLGKHGLSVSIARCFAFSGKYLPKDQHYAFGNFLGQAEKGETVTVKTKGIVYRSYLNADELVISLFKILQLSEIVCPIYNVGSDESRKLHEIAEEIAMEYGVDCSYNITNNNIIDRYVPDITKLKKILK